MHQTEIPVVSVIIANYNTPELTINCIESVHLFLSVRHEVIVVESGVERQILPEEIDRWGIVHIPTTTRRGFGAANNLGAARARGDYLWLLNSDTIVPDGRINELFPLLDRNPTTGLLSPMLFSDHTLTRTQSDFYAHFQSLPSLLTRRPRPNIDWNTQQHRDLILTDLIVAAAMVVRTDLFRKLGGFDERYFMYMEDDDLCYRARKLGWQAAITPKAAVVHLQGKSISRSRERKQFYYASQQLFWKTHYGW